MEPISEMTGPAANLPPAVKQAVAEQLEKQAAIAEANARPFPGPLAQAFSPAQDIAVGPRSVRPFYDGDFDVLQALDHPLARMADGKEEWGKTWADIRGADAKVLCYMFTSPVEATEAHESDLEQLRALAKRHCARYQMRDFVAVLQAVMEQFNRYWATAQGFEADDGEGKKKQSSPTSPA